MYSGMASSSTTNTRRAALYVRVRTAKGQTVENQLQPLQGAARRLGCSIVLIYRDEGISDAKSREKRPDLMHCSRVSPAGGVANRGPTSTATTMEYQPSAFGI